MSALDESARRGRYSRIGPVLLAGVTVAATTPRQPTHRSDRERRGRDGGRQEHGVLADLAKARGLVVRAGRLLVNLAAVLFLYENFVSSIPQVLRRLKRALVVAALSPDRPSRHYPASGGKLLLAPILGMGGRGGSGPGSSGDERV